MSRAQGPAESPDSPPHRALFVLAFSVALLGTIGSIHRAGLWDPPELETAELARRIAEGLFGAPGFGGSGREDVPTRGELGRGELPFTLMALGFRAFGVVAWAGRLPLALAALLGLGALFVLMRRLAGPRAGALGMLCLATTPLYFVQARTMLGEIVTMAAASIAMAGLALAVFDRCSGRARAIALCAGLGGLAAGFGARGLLVGVALPALGVGLAWLLLALAGAAQDRLGTAFGAAILGIAVLAALIGARAIAATPVDRYSIWVGAWPASARMNTTFDEIARDVGHAVFPWSALIPWACGRLLGPIVTAKGVEPERAQALRLVLLATAAIALIAATALEPVFGDLAFTAPAALGGIAALALHDLDFGAPASRAFGLVVAALALVLLIDFQNFPEKALTAFGAFDAALPVGVVPLPFTWLALSVVLPVALFFMLVQESSADRERVFRRVEYLAWPRAFMTLWNGNLFFGALLGASGLLTLELFFALADRVPALHRFGAPGELSRGLVRLGWVGIVLACVSPPVVLFGRDLLRVVLSPGVHVTLFARSSRLRRLELGRGATSVVLLSLTGIFLSLWYYPALSAQVSSKPAAETYRRVAKPNESLAAFDVGAQALCYENVGRVEEFSAQDGAISWLAEGRERRFLVFPSRDLATLNAGFRERLARTNPWKRSNLPVLATGSNQFLLAVSRLAPGEVNSNPLADCVLDHAPAPSHPLDADLAGKLQVLGWDVKNSRGENVDHVSAGLEFEFVAYYRVQDRLSGDWETFIHVDGFGRRFNGDHPTLGGRYPFSLWQKGDIVADRARIELEPNFVPGSYDVYFGLYNGSRRLEVRRGAHEENRIIAGRLVVR